jgi:glutaconyl-CoA/methylmalonyl-CoA decarboxylase subunit delta
MMPKVINMNIRQKLRRQGKHKEAEVESLEITGEVNAAISVALHLYFNEMHDEESNVMTIKKVSKRYSPWSSKIYGLNTYGRN